MFIHVQYGKEIEDYIIGFENKCFIAASDVLKKARYRYEQDSILQLFNEHGVPLKPSHLIENARSYRIKDHPK